MSMGGQLTLNTAGSVMTVGTTIVGIVACIVARVFLPEEYARVPYGQGRAALMLP
jgi:hypothetical protein